MYTYLQKVPLLSSRSKIRFCSYVFDSKLITVGEDFVMKVHDLSDGTLVEKQIIEMTDENYALATNNLDKIAFGGIEKKVYLQTVSLDADQQLQLEGELNLAMQFDSSVTKLEFVGAKHLLAVSEDSAVQIMDLESGKVQSFRTGQHKGSVRNAAVDPLMDYLATVGCDGNLHIHSLQD